MNNTHFSFDLAMMGEPIVAVSYELGQASTLPLSDPPLCSLRFHSLSLNELSYLAALAYINRDSEGFISFFKTFLPGWELRETKREDRSPVIFLDFYSADRNVSVIAIKVCGNI